MSSCNNRPSLTLPKKSLTKGILSEIKVYEDEIEFEDSDLNVSPEVSPILDKNFVKKLKPTNHMKQVLVFSKGYMTDSKPIAKKTL
jgi:hypothetical protein